MTQSRLTRIQQTLAYRLDDFCVMLDKVHKPHNLSAIIRTCDATGVPAVHAIETDHRDIRAYRSSASGSEHWVDLNIHHCPTQLINQFKSEGKQILAAHLSDTAVDFRAIDYCKPTALIMGAEKWGVCEQTASQADHHIIIPMVGMVESLNVSVAAAVILFEMQRQRQLRGLYSLDKPIDQYKLFEWMQPKMARLCQQKGWSYPELDQDGDLKDPAKWFKQMKQAASQ